jgi:outer membrane protein
MKTLRVIGLSLVCGLLFCSVGLGVANAKGEAKAVTLGTISIPEVLAASKAGSEAQKVVQAKLAEYQPKFEKEQKALEEQKNEIEKKTSVWSEEVKGAKERDYQKQLREFQLKSEDAQYELKQLEKKVMGPILKELHEAIAKISKDKGLTMVMEYTKKGLESRNGLLYADESIDISDQVRQELDKRTATTK